MIGEVIADISGLHRGVTGNAISLVRDVAFMSDHPDPEWRSYVEDDDDDDYSAPDPFALPLPNPAEQENR